MSHGHDDNRSETALVPRSAASEREVYQYELEICREDALARLDSVEGVPVLSGDELERPPSGQMYIERDEDSFVIHSPGVAPQAGADLSEIGTQVMGRVVATPHGSRLEVRVQPMATTRSQRAKFVATLVVTVAALAGLLGSGYATQALWLGALVAGIFGAALLPSYRRRRRRSRELLAIVQRIFGPAVRAELDGPYRVRSLPPG